MSENIIGIDLGTTNSEVAIVINGKVEILEIHNGSCLLPSVVSVADDGLMLVGDAALNQYTLYPERTVKSIKRQMGSNQKVSLNGQDYTPQEISALILKRLKQIAEKHIGEPIQKAVITVPAYFSDAQRQATRDAGKIADLDVVRIINEPTAAAMAYESHHQGQKHIMVYDLGGGTFDVSIVRLEDDVVEVLASHGDNHLGGDDFDQKIIDYVIQHLSEEYGVSDDDITSQVMARIRRAAETAKIRLSTDPFAMIEEEYLLNVDDKIVHLSLELSRRDYEEMITPFIDKTLQASHIAIEGAKLSVSDLDEILLVGGATRTPLVSLRLENEVGLPTRQHINPDLCVASGAATQAAVIAGNKVNSVLIDVTPYTFGTSAVSMLDGELYPHKFIPIIRKNTAIPASHTEVFYTFHDDQEEVNVAVYQGEDQDALNNIEIGDFLMKGLSKVPEGNEILTTFNLDIDGILQVTSIEKCTGMEVSIIIDNAISQFDDEAVTQAKRRIGTLLNESDIVDIDAIDVKSSKKNHVLIEKAETLMESASEDDREDLVNGVEQLKDLLAQGADIEEASAELSDLVYYLES